MGSRRPSHLELLTPHITLLHSPLLPILTSPSLPLSHLLLSLSPSQVEHEKKKKEQGKRARGDREEVLDLLFTAFQQHQYYNFRDLVHKTKQPPVSEL